MAMEIYQIPIRSQPGETLKNWFMVVLTLAFVALYGAALTGWLKPLADEQMVLRLEPIIFVIIGFYFGRLPAQHNERLFKEETNRQTLRADAAQHAKEHAQQERQALEEKLKNVNAALTPAIAIAGSGNGLPRNGNAFREESLQYSVGTALRILRS
jgi:hypothetical protein